MERILILSHGHPEEHPGGGEVAAYQEHNELRRIGIDSLFVAASDPPRRHLDSPFGVHADKDHEVLFFGTTDPFMHSQQDLRYLWQDFRQLLTNFDPTVVHVQHFTRLGLELIRELRNHSEQLPIVLTLHEHLAICNNSGFMIKTSDGSLCRRSSPNQCSECFPEIPPDRFLLRKLWIQSVFELVDLFVTPSEFLRQRFIDWGLAPESIVVIENGQPPVEATPLRQTEASRPRNRFAFFGQMAPHKGIQVLLDAFQNLPAAIPVSTHLSIHGGNLEFQTDDFRELIKKHEDNDAQAIEWTGAYEVSEIPSLIATVDWVIVPSVWWENSPLVIQEAFAHRRPVICSDIGGMAEKVRHEHDGLHFRMGRADDLAATILRAATEPGLWDHLVHNIEPAPSIEATCQILLGHFEALIEKKSGKFSIQTVTG